MQNFEEALFFKLRTNKQKKKKKINNSSYLVSFGMREAGGNNCGSQLCFRFFSVVAGYAKTGTEGGKVIMFRRQDERGTRMLNKNNTFRVAT